MWGIPLSLQINEETSEHPQTIFKGLYSLESFSCCLDLTLALKYSRTSLPLKKLAYFWVRAYIDASRVKMKNSELNRPGNYSYEHVMLVCLSLHCFLGVLFKSLIYRWVPLPGNWFFCLLLSSLSSLQWAHCRIQDNQAYFLEKTTEIQWDL